MIIASVLGRGAGGTLFGLASRGKPKRKPMPLVVGMDKVRKARERTSCPEGYVSSVKSSFFRLFKRDTKGKIKGI